MKRFFISISVFIICQLSYSQEVYAQLNFKHIDCGVRRGVSCNAKLVGLTDQRTNSWNTVFTIDKNGALLMSVFRKVLTKNEEIQILGKNKPAEKGKSSDFVLNEEDILNTEIYKELVLLKPSLERKLAPKKYTTMISEDYITIILKD